MSNISNYERFKLEWLISHGYSLTDLIHELSSALSDAQETQHDISLEEVFSEWENDTGFGGEIYPCYEEYLDCEGREDEGREDNDDEKKEEPFHIIPMTFDDGVDRYTFLENVKAAMNHYDESRADCWVIEPRDDFDDFRAAPFVEWLKNNRTNEYQEFMKYNILDHEEYPDAPDFYLDVNDRRTNVLDVLNVMSEYFEELEDWESGEEICLDLYVDYCTEHPVLAEAVYNKICEYHAQLVENSEHDESEFTAVNNKNEDNASPLASVFVARSFVGESNNPNDSVTIHHIRGLDVLKAIGECCDMWIKTTDEGKAFSEKLQAQNKEKVTIGELVKLPLPVELTRKYGFEISTEKAPESIVNISV